MTFWDAQRIELGWYDGIGVVYYLWNGTRYCTIIPLKVIPAHSEERS